MTATKPTDPVKVKILKDLKLLSVYELSLDEAVKLSLVAPYDITIVTTTLDTGEKYIKAGNAKKVFYQNEKERYNYLSRCCLTTPSKRYFLGRMRFIYDLKSKTEAAKYILENIIPKELRTLIFCGSILQAIEVCDRRFFSKPTYSKKKGLEFKTQAQQDAHMERELAKLLKVAEKMEGYEKDAAYIDFKAKKINRMSCIDALNEGENIEDLDVAFIIQVNSKELDLIQRIGRLIRYRLGHIGRIIILCVEDSVDKDWVRKAMINLNPVNIKWIELSRLKMNIETISFD